jgi:hypothetical protein
MCKTAFDTGAAAPTKSIENGGKMVDKYGESVKNDGFRICLM